MVLRILNLDDHRTMHGTGFGLGFATKLETKRNEPAAALDEHHWGGMADIHSLMSSRTNIMGFCLTQRVPGVAEYI